MRTLHRALLGTCLVFLFGRVARAQNETFSAGSGGQYDTSVCKDAARIKLQAQQLGATPFHDGSTTAEASPLRLALELLAEQPGNHDITHAYGCLRAPGVVFFVPNNLVGQVTKLIGEIVAVEGGSNGNGASGNASTSGQSGWPGGGSESSGTNGRGGTNGGNPGGNRGNSGGPYGNRGGPGTGSTAPMPGPAGGIGYTPGPNPCLPKGPGGYDYCANGPGARLPAGCYCDGPPPSGPPAQPSVRTTRPVPNPNKPLVDTLQYTAGFMNGIGDCVQGMVDMAAGAGWMARGAADLLNPTPFSFANGDEFVNSARLLGVQPGQSITLRQIAVEMQAQVVGQNTNPYDAATAAGRRFCAYAVVPGVTKALKGGKKPPAANTPGSAPSSPLDGPTLQGAISDDGTVGTLPGKLVQTPTGPVQLGNFVGKGTFGAVFEDGANPSQVIKIATDNPFSPESFSNQVKGSNLLKRAGVPTANIKAAIPGAGGQPPMLILDNIFKEPGAFQLTSKGFKRTQATINAREGNGLNASAGSGQMQRASAAEINAVDDAMQNLSNKIGGAGLIMGDLHAGNVVLVPKPGGGFTAVVVDADFTMTKNDFVKQLGGKTGQQLLTGPGVSPILTVILPILQDGGMLGALGSNLTAQGVMNALSEARTKITNRANGFVTPAPSNTLFPATIPPRVN